VARSNFLLVLFEGFDSVSICRLFEHLFTIPSILDFISTLRLNFSFTPIYYLFHF
jgi:hypothetical protein